MDRIVVRARLTCCWLMVLICALSVGLGHAQQTIPGAETAVETEPADFPPAAVADDSNAPPTEQANSASSPDSTEGAETSAKFVPPADEQPTANLPLPSAPDVYLLPDESGKLRKVLGFRYEDFVKAWQQKPTTDVVAPPRYVLDHWTVSGAAHDSHVELAIELEIAIQTQGWVEIPIQLPELLVQKIEISDQQPGECLTFEKQRYGHVLWLSGESGAKRTLRVEGLTKLNPSASEQILELHLPRAVTTNFSLQLPASATSLQTSPELALKRTNNPDETIQVELLGQTNPVRLGWKAETTQLTAEQAPLSVEEQTTIQLDRRHATYRTKLLVNSFDRPVQQIRVQLPIRTTLTLSDSQAPYEIKKVSSDASDDQHQVVEVRLLQPSLQPWTVELTADRPIESFGDSTECRLEGFQVIDADQQSGRLSLEVDDQLLAYVDLHGEVQQIPVAAGTTVSEGRSLLGQFRYVRFPWQIVAFSSPRQKRVSVRPRYDLTISADEARLDAQYDYQLTGARIFSMRMKLNGWKRTEAPIESGGKIDPNSVVERHDGRLALRLVDPSTPQLTLKLSFRKDIQPGKNTFFFPEPMEAYLVDGELMVSSSDSLQLDPLYAESVGLGLRSTTEDQTSSSEAAANTASQGIPLRIFLPQPKLVTEISQRPQEIEATQTTKVAIDRAAIQVKQDFNYVVKHEPVSRLTLNVPEPLWQNSSLRITLNGESVPFALSPATDESSTASTSSAVGAEATTQTESDSLRPVVVTLPRPMQNEIPLKLSYQQSTPNLVADELEALRVPLATTEDPLGAHQIEVTAQQAVVSAHQRSDSLGWELVANQRGDELAGQTLKFRTNSKLSFLPLYAQLPATEEAQLATLERAWIQTWVAVGRRQERAVFRFHTEHRKAFVQLPTEFENPDLELLLDGTVWPYELLEGNRLAIAFPASNSEVSHTLELRYQRPVTLPSWGHLSSTVPQLECRVASAPIYWQLILPQGWQLTGSPAQLIPDYWLGWRHYRWGRQPTLSQEVLEQHTGAEPLMAPPPLSNQYIFRAFELPARVQYVVVRRMWVIMACAIGVFGVGLLCLYTPIARNGYFWLALSVGLLAGIWCYPEATILLIELILIGCLMTLVTHLLRRVFGGGPAPSTVTSTIQLPASEITEPWQEVRSGALPFNESTTALKTGGPTP